MLFLPLLQLIFNNIARFSIYCSMVLVQKCLFSQLNKLKAYPLEIEHIETCNSKYVKGWNLWMDSERAEIKPNSRDIKRQIAMVK